MKVKCPTCGNVTIYEECNSYRPFCSERCQTIDLGAWADERYKLPMQVSEDITDGETAVSEGESFSVNENSEGKRPPDLILPPKHHLN